ncbi:MAG: glycosyltransferase [Candidatus Methanomethylicia archaeon]
MRMLQIVTPTIQPIHATILVIAIYSLVWTIIIFHSIYYWIGRKREYKINKYNLDLEKAPEITVIIPTVNESINIILRLIEALSKQSYPKDKMEIIIVSDDTKEKYMNIENEVMKASSKYNLNIKIYRREERRGFKAGALNYALKRSNGKYIVVFDADAIPKEDLIEKAIAYMEGEKLDAIATKWSTLNMNDSPLSEAQAISMEFLTSIILRGRAISRKPIMIPGCGCIFKRDVLMELGGWNEESLAEDLDLSVKLVTKGKRIGYLDETEVKVEVPSNYEDFKKQQSRWIYGAVQTLVKNATRIINAKIPLIWKIDVILYLLQYQAVLANFAMAILAISSIIVRMDIISQITPLIPITIVLSALEAASYMHTAKKLGLKTWKSITIMGRCTALATALAIHILLQDIKIIFGKREKWNITPKGEIAKKSSSRRSGIIESITTIMGLIAMIILLIFGYKASALCILTLTIPYAYVTWKTTNKVW